MCKYCDEKWYMDSEIYHSDAGYGDDDYITKYKNLLCTFICPVCGTLRPSAEKLFGSKEKALAYIISKNCEFESSEIKGIHNQIDEIYKVASKDKLLKLLEANGLSIDEENKTLVHDCGHVIIDNFPIDLDSPMLLTKIQFVMESSDMNFCNKCGKRIYPFSTRIVDKETPYSIDPVLMISSKDIYLRR